MKRFFFDYRTRGRSLLDYRGHEFHNPQGAIEFAQEIAHGLQHSLSENWIGWTVEVRDSEGERYCSLSIEGQARSVA